tara:strand:- start:195 stop:476 length:282 start_codon:yes stop_codon:yes gene_type:complete
MRLLNSTLLGILICLSVSSCNKDENNVETNGTIQKQGITTYQYGTHVITGYALRSGTLDLDNYIGQTVTVVGYLVKGYPVDGGPDYIEVEEIK